MKYEKVIDVKVIKIDILGLELKIKKVET